ncbi:thioredoxin family protein [Oleidesulfovibrio sp.]|uniref:thioredoxin family protein n=1 Tax=Oleidesulfovibrio sp. TaxID=2909707 RepID=UPI003A8B9CDC
MFTELIDANFDSTVAATESGVVIFFKKQCPHCKNMEKVLEKFSAKNPEVALFNVDSEENPETTAKLEAERAPTIFVVKGGAVVARKAGLMNPKEMKAFFAAA